MGLIKVVDLLDIDSSAEEVKAALLNDPHFFPGKVADEIDPDNKIRKIKKVDNVEFLMRQNVDDVIAAYNTVALRRALRIKNVKQAIPFVTFGLNFLSGKANDKQLKAINAIKIIIQTIF